MIFITIWWFHLFFRSLFICFPPNLILNNVYNSLVTDSDKTVILRLEFSTELIYIKYFKDIYGHLRIIRSAYIIREVLELIISSFLYKLAIAQCPYWFDVALKMTHTRETFTFHKYRSIILFVIHCIEQFV